MKKPFDNPPSLARLSPLVRDMIESNMSSKTDPNGSYTGKPIHPHEKPVQDADDL